MAVNTVTVSGRATRDPELRHTQSGHAVCEFGIAVDEYKKDAENEVSFFDVVVWNAFGELIANKLTKGDLLTVQGRLRQDRWQTEGGENRSKVRITASQIDGQFMFKKSEEYAHTTGGDSQQTTYDDDIPF
jgi:single-strand DNA-binding protein